MGRTRPDLAQRNRERATHRMTKSKPWKAWSSMRERCWRESHRFYSRYGGRGITVCERWDSFENFLSDMGPPPQGTWLDRIDNDGDYTPENCRWATPHQQANNRSSNVLVSHDGRTMTVAEWSRESGLERKTLEWRIRAGWAPSRAIETPSTFPRKERRTRANQ